jgi:hypothetical protein
MALKTEDLYDKAMALSADVEDNFIDMGRTLRQLIDRDLDLFQQVPSRGQPHLRSAARPEV